MKFNDLNLNLIFYKNKKYMFLINIYKILNFEFFL